MPSKRQKSPMVLPDQFPPPNTNGPTALPLQNKAGIHRDVFVAGRLSGCLHAARRRSTRSSTNWSHPLLKAYVNQLDTAVDP